jgi:hypothetical protein
MSGAFIVHLASFSKPFIPSSSSSSCPQAAHHVVWKQQKCKEETKHRLTIISSSQHDCTLRALFFCFIVLLRGPAFLFCFALFLFCFSSSQYLDRATEIKKWVIIPCHIVSDI